MDCLEGLKLMSDDSATITITSPPYNLEKQINTNSNIYSQYEDNLSEEEYYIFIKKVITELIRVTKYYVFFNFQILSNNKSAYLKIISDFKENIKDIIIWHKKQFTPPIQPTVLGSEFEFVFVFTKKEFAQKKSFEYAFFNNREKGQLNGNVIYGNSASFFKTTADYNIKGQNKATFPKYFVRWFVDKFTAPGDIILDPFMGSGTTAIVAQENGRFFIGFEIEQAQIDLSFSKLKQKTLLEVNENE